MKLTFSDTDRIKIAIEENLIDLFRAMNCLQRYSLNEREHYSAIFNKNIAWPNYVFNLNIEEKECERYFSEINLGIKNNELPSFIISGPKTEQNFYEEVLYEFDIRKIMQWPAMAIDLRGINFIENGESEIKKVESESDLDSWLQIVSAELFNNVGLDKTTFLKLLSNLDIRLYLGFANEIAVSTAMLYLNETVAGIYMVATSKEYRNQGFGKQITNRLLNESKNLNYQTAVLQATPDGHPLYIKIGFKEMGMFNIYWKIGKTLK